MNSDGSVYSSIVRTFNGRDQVEKILESVGPENVGGQNQLTALNYDGYGRLSTQHVPEQDPNMSTVYAYNADDSVQSLTDARGAKPRYSYNARHLVTRISYTAPANIASTPNVTFDFDAAGNRISMGDGLGTVKYNYEQLSRLKSEARTFTDPANAALNNVTSTISYDYNLAGLVFIELILV